MPSDAAQAVNETQNLAVAARCITCCIAAATQHWQLPAERCVRAEAGWHHPTCLRSSASSRRSSVGMGLPSALRAAAVRRQRWGGSSEAAASDGTDAGESMRHSSVMSSACGIGRGTAWQWHGAAGRTLERLPDLALLFIQLLLLALQALAVQELLPEPRVAPQHGGGLGAERGLHERQGAEWAAVAAAAAAVLAEPGTHGAAAMPALNQATCLQPQGAASVQGRAPGGASGGEGADGPASVLE